MKQKLHLLALLLILTLLPAQAFAANSQNVDLTVTIRDFKADGVLFEGDIGFYGKCGFTYAREFGIRYHDLPEGADDSFFLCKELIPGYLDSIAGIYQTPLGYYVDDSDVEEFDKHFPPKQKLKLPGQLF